MIYYQNIFDLYTCLITCIAISHKNIMGKKLLWMQKPYKALIQTKHEGTGPWRPRSSFWELDSWDGEPRNKVTTIQARQRREGVCWCKTVIKNNPGQSIQELVASGTLSVYSVSLQEVWTRLSLWGETLTHLTEQKRVRAERQAVWVSSPRPPAPEKLSVHYS